MRQKTIASGPSSTTDAGRRCATPRSAEPTHARASWRAPDAADGEQHANEISEQHDRDGRRAGWSPLWMWLKTNTDGDLGLERQVARDQHDRADLADRARERERDAGEDPGEDVRQHDPAEHGAARPRRASAPPPPSPWSSSSSTGCTVRTTNGSVTNSSASKIAVRVNATLIPTGECGP